MRQTDCLIDYEALRLIVANAPELFDKGFLNQHDPRNQYQVIRDRQTCLTIVFEFFKQFNEYGQATIEYETKKHLPDGRLWATTPSLQGISRRIRHTVSRGKMVDLDMKNAHPNFLIELCQKHNLLYPHLNRYVLHREQVLEEIVSKGIADTREDAKRTVLKIINGGGCFNINNHAWLRQFSLEMSSIRKTLIDDHYPQYLQSAILANGKGYENLYGSALNHLLCVMERAVLEKMVSFCDQHHLKIGVLCHDGLMLIQDAKTDYDDIARRMSQSCGVEIVVKDMDEAIPLDNLSLKDIDYEVDMIERFIVKKILGLDRVNPYNLFPIYLLMRPSVLTNFKYYRCDKSSQCLWFERMNDGRWFKTQEPIFLSKDIAKCFTRYGNHILNDLTNQLEELVSKNKEHTEQVKAQLDKEMASISKMRNKDKMKIALKEFKSKQKETLQADNLQSTASMKSLKSKIFFISSLMNECQGRFRDPILGEIRTEIVDNEIIDKLDENKHLLGFSNGVYDFHSGCFRPIRVDDFIQKSTKYEFPSSSNPEKRKFIENVFKSLFIRKYAVRLTDPSYEEEDDPEQVENYECFLDCIALGLVGGNIYQRFYIMTGEGSNGKSCIQSVIKKITGDYTTTLDVSTLTNPKKNNNATSDLPKTKGCRYVFISESDTTQTLSAAVIKTITGHDELSEREVFSRSINFTPQFIPILPTNSKPQLKMDEAIARRVFIMEFKFRFFGSKDDQGFVPSQFNKTHFLGKDITLEEKLFDCKEEIILFLIERYNHIKNGGRNPSSKQFVKATQQYFQDQDVFASFIQDNFTQTTNKNEMIKHKILLECFNNSVGPNSRVDSDFVSRKMTQLGIESKLIHSAKHYFIREKTDTERNPQCDDDETDTECDTD